MALTDKHTPLRDLCVSCEWAETVKEVRGSVAHELHVCFYNRGEFPTARSCPEFSPTDNMEDED